MKRNKRQTAILILSNLLVFIMSAQLLSQSLPAADDITTSAGNVRMHFIGHGSLMFEINNYVIQIDPVRSSGDYTGRGKADLILITHEHSDHLDGKLIEELRKPSTLLFASKAAASSVEGAVSMQAGDMKKAGDVTVEAVHAYNIINERSKGMPFHPKGAGLGFILTIGDKRFYVAGDTENTPEMKALSKIDVAFLPMNLPYTMTPEMVADAARAFRPAVLYPYHYGSTDTSVLTGLLKDSGIEVRIRDLK